MDQLMRLGLTGGIGSGKSSVAAFFAQLGAAVIDLDAISHRLSAAGGLAIDHIVRVFGPQMLNAEGGLERQKMRQLVFADPWARQTLQHILHPLIADQARLQADLAQQQQPRPLCVLFEVPLLVESDYWRRQFDAVLVVDCSEQSQIQRTVARSQLTVPAVQAIMAAQASRRFRLQAADAVIFNDGITLPALRQQVVTLAKLCRLSLAPAPTPV